MDVGLIGVLTGLVTMVFFGLSDFFAARSSKQTTPIQTLFIAWFLGLLILSPFAVTQLNSLSSWDLVFKILFYSFNFSLGNYLFYRALEIGPVSIISPISSSYPLITVLIAVFIFGEKLVTGQYLAIALVLSGVFLASFHLEKFPIHITKRWGIVYTLVAVLLWGTAIPVAGQVISQIGWLMTLFWQFLFGLIWLYLMHGVRGGWRSVWGSGINKTIAAIGVTYLVATASFNIGLERSLASIVTPVTSTYPLVTAVLALTVLKEKVLKNQLIGAAIIILGIVLLAIG